MALPFTALSSFSWEHLQTSYHLIGLRIGQVHLSHRLTSGHSAVFTCYHSSETQRQEGWKKQVKGSERERENISSAWACKCSTHFNATTLFFLLHSSPRASQATLPVPHTRTHIYALCLTDTPMNATRKSSIRTGTERKNECYRAREAREGETVRDVLSLIKLASTKAGWKAQSRHSVARCTHTKSLPGLKCLHNASCRFQLRRERERERARKRNVLSSIQVYLYVCEWVLCLFSELMRM